MSNPNTEFTENGSTGWKYFYHNEGGNVLIEGNAGGGTFNIYIKVGSREKLLDTNTTGSFDEEYATKYGDALKVDLVNSTNPNATVRISGFEGRS